MHRLAQDDGTQKLLKQYRKPMQAKKDVRTHRCDDIGGGEHAIGKVDSPWMQATLRRLSDTALHA